MKVKAQILDKCNLTHRECEVLALVCEGAVDKVISRQLAISKKTINAHMAAIYSKMDVREDNINVRCKVISAAVSKGMVRLYKDRRRVSRDALPS